MDKIAVYIHGKDGNVNEAEHYKPLFPQYNVKRLRLQSADTLGGKERISVRYPFSV